MGKKIIGIGNALMDVVVKLPDESLFEQCGLTKGGMLLVDTDTSAKINDITSKYERVVTPGGSVCNTISGLASLGADAAFIGMVGPDEMGKIYRKEMLKTGATPKMMQTSTSTGVSMVMVTPDGERTFATCLGAAIALTAGDITSELFYGYDIVYIEGYLVQNQDLVRKVAKIAKDMGMQVAIDLASFNVVTENLEFLKEIISKYIDIVFANESEAQALTGKEAAQAVDDIANMVELAIVKIGKEGSLVKAQGKETIKIGIEKSFKCVDTTGAGDLYASGFLYALSQGKSLDICGKAGALTSGYVISVYGARMDINMWKDINCEMSAINK